MLMLMLMFLKRGHSETQVVTTSMYWIGVNRGAAYGREVEGDTERDRGRHRERDSSAHRALDEIIRNFCAFV